MNAGAMQLGGVRVVAGIPGSVTHTLDGQVWPTPTSPPSGDSLLRRVQNLLLRRVIDRRRRVARNELGRLDERMLRDLGIERDQIADVVGDLANKQLREGLRTLR